MLSSSQKGKHGMSTKRSIFLLLMILFSMGCAIMGRSAEDTTAPDAEEPAETPRELATSEQPLGEEEEGGGFDWASEYNRLAQKIEAEYDEPKNNPYELGEYLKWMEVKAADRGAVDKLYRRALDLSNIDSENQEIADWIEKFQKLLERVQESGCNTTRSALWLMEFERRFTESWEGALWKVQNFGRDLYGTALETGFCPERVRDYAMCLIRFAVRDVESGLSGLYSGRSLTSEAPLLDYDAEITDTFLCKRRTEFSVEAEGEAVAPADKGLECVEQIRKECDLDLWRFGQERADATELMEEFYKDVMCKNPRDKGHKWYHEQAEKYHLDKAIEYNEGFYAAIYGKVEVQRGEERKPAPGAFVRVYAPKDDQEWTTTANEDGEYKIERVLLHKESKPFEISAEYKGDRVDDSYDGPLKEPDTAYEFEKDLLIAPKTWKGTVTGKKSVNFEGTDTDVATGLPKEFYTLAEGSATLDFEVRLTRSNLGWDYYHDVVAASGTFDQSGETGLRYLHLACAASDQYYWHTEHWTHHKCSGTWDEVTVVLNVNEETKQYVLGITSMSSTVCSYTIVTKDPDPSCPEDSTETSEMIVPPMMGLSFKGSFEGNTISGSWSKPVGDQDPGVHIGYQDPGSEWTLVLTRGED
jgi:hypothetical protein